MPTTIADLHFDLVGPDNLTEEKATSIERREYPFKSRGDTSTVIVKQDYQVLIPYYTPPNPSARHPNYANIFFIEDTDPQDSDKIGVGSFTRTWASLPGMSSDGRLKKFVRSEYESHVATIPGIQTSQTGFQDRAIANVYISGGKHYITTTVAHGIELGRLVAIKYNVYDPLDKSTRVGMVQTKVTLTGTAGTLLVVDEIKDVNTIDIQTVSRSGTQTGGRKRTVLSRVDYTYYLPGVNVTSESDIPIVQQMEIMDNTTGGIVDYIGDATTPTFADYMDLVRQKQWYCAESTTHDRWKGEIIEAKTRYCRYQL